MASAPGRIVHLSSELRRIAASEQMAGLRDELDGRWSIVETSFTTGVGRSLMEQGLAADLENFLFVDKLRRRPVTGVKEALIGFRPRRN